MIPRDHEQPLARERQRLEHLFDKPRPQIELRRLPPICDIAGDAHQIDRPVVEQFGQVAWPRVPADHLGPTWRLALDQPRTRVDARGRAQVEIREMQDP